GRCIVIGFVWNHRCECIERPGRLARYRRIDPSGESPGAFLDLRYRIGLQRTPKRIRLQGSVQIEPEGADGEELPQFADEVLIRLGAGRGIGLLTVDQREIGSHYWANRHLTEQSAIVTERVASQYVIVLLDHRGRIAGAILIPNVCSDDYLAKSQGHSLAELVGIPHRILKESQLHRETHEGARLQLNQVLIV